jgi:flagellar basal-body rod protein FlgB
MNLNDIPLFSMLKSRLGYISQRERLIAQNVANADTAGYTPQDLKPFTLPKAGGAGAASAIRLERTRSSHLGGSGLAAGAGAASWKAVSTPDSEATLNGNKVVLEDQMSKMTEARMDYEAVIGFYQKSLDLLRLAARAPGK